MIITRIGICLISLSVLLSLSCSSDDSGLLNNGEMSAIINGDFVNLKAEKAKIFAGANGNITIQGSSCSNNYAVVILKVPIAVGNYTPEGDIDMNFYRSRAIACDETGSSSPKRTVEANVTVTEVTDSRIKGTFRIIAESFDPQIEVKDIIENGVFDVQRDEVFE